MKSNLLTPSTLTPAERAGEVRIDPMAPRIVKGLEANFEPATYDAEEGNKSGLTPWGPNVLIRMDQCMEVTTGGILIDVNGKVEQMNEACTTGCIYEIAPHCFRGMSDHPQVGQRVHIERYAGIKVTGRDGRMYRVVDEKCIACTVDSDLCVSEI